MSGLDIFLGDPIYDDQNRVVRREFGVKNVIAIAIVLYVGNVLMGQMKPKSGGGKMKGGQGWGGVVLVWGYVITTIVGWVFMEIELFKAFLKGDRTDIESNSDHVVAFIVSIPATVIFLGGAIVIGGKLGVDLS